MQLFVFCFFVVGVICLIQGLRKSTFGPVTGTKQYCALCGWTKEKVWFCQVTQNNITKVTPVCLDCSLKHNAQPIHGTFGSTTNTVCG